MFASSSGGLAIEHEVDGQRCIVRLIGDLDRRTAPRLVGFLDERCVPSEEILLDLRQLVFIDASGIGAILDAHKKCAERGGALTATAAGPAVQGVLQRVLQITGLRRIGPFESQSQERTAANRLSAVIEASPTGGTTASGAEGPALAPSFYGDGLAAFGARACRQQDLEQGAEVDVALRCKRDWQVGPHRVAIAAPFARAREVAGLDQVGHDSLCRALGDVRMGGDVAHAQLRILGDAEEDEAMVGQERERRHALIMAYGTAYRESFLVFPDTRLSCRAL
jgi:anti-anti-sigma factor